MKRCAIYVRKSIQTGRGESINNQVEMCINYASERDIIVDETLIYYDEGYSGKDMSRPGFKKMITDLKNEKFNVLICYRLDRISRSLNDFTKLTKLLDNYSVSFISIKEHFDTSNPIGKSMMYIASVFSELERETIRERVKDNIHSLSKTGRWLGGIAPTGFKSVLINSIDDDLNKKSVYELVPVQSELFTIKILFDNFLRFRSLSKLEIYCIKSNLKSKNNISFSKTTLKQILVNPVYCVGDSLLYEYLISQNFSISNLKDEFNGERGVLLYKINGEKIISVSSHKGVIKSKDWIETQKILSSNSNVPFRQGTSSLGLLSGLTKCNNCGSIMRVKYGRKTKTHISYYYVCTLKQKNKEKCNNSNLNGTYIDSIMREEISKLFRADSFLNYFLNYICLDRNYMEDTVFNIGKMSIKTDCVVSSRDRMNTLKAQLEINKESASHKYISKQIDLINSNISHLNTNKMNLETSHLLSELTYFYERKISNFDIANLNFKNQKYILNKIIDYTSWSGYKFKIYFK